jgi:Domain of Unknown Function (DUF928)
MVAHISLNRSMKSIVIVTATLISVAMMAGPTQASPESEKIQNIGAEDSGGDRAKKQPEVVFNERDSGDRGSCEMAKPPLAVQDMPFGQNSLKEEDANLAKIAPRLNEMLSSLELLLATNDALTALDFSQDSSKENSFKEEEANLPKIAPRLSPMLSRLKPPLATHDSLTALIPLRGKINSTIAQPVLWFYVAFSSAAQRSGVLILQNQQGQEVTRSAAIALPRTPGIIGVPLPQPLPPNQPHHFFFAVNCGEAATHKTIEVGGWINWAPPEADLLAQLKQSKSLEQTVNFYAKAGYWVDILTLLAPQRDRSPAASELWTAVFAQEELEKIAPRPIFSGDR